MIQIKSRHNFLEGFLGTKPEEDISYATANEVNLWITVITCCCCILEIVLYFVYNRMVNNLKSVTRGGRLQDPLLFVGSGELFNLTTK